MNATVPDNILRIIKAKGMKQRAVAERIGMSDQMFSDILNGRRLIKPSDIVAISRALDTTPNELFTPVRTA